MVGFSSPLRTSKRSFSQEHRLIVRLPVSFASVFFLTCAFMLATFFNICLSSMFFPGICSNCCKVIYTFLSNCFCFCFCFCLMSVCFCSVLLLDECLLLLGASAWWVFAFARCFCLMSVCFCSVLLLDECLLLLGASAWWVFAFALCFCLMSFCFCSVLLLVINC